MLNNRGWGISNMMVLTGILILALFVVVLLISNLSKNLTSNLNQDNINNTNSYDIVVEKKTNSSMESDMKIAAQEYINKYYTDLPIGDNIRVTVRNLISNNYLEALYDMKDNTKKCSGYVSVYRLETGFTYNSYLKCPSYTTKGYIARLDDVY